MKNDIKSDAQKKMEQAYFSLLAEKNYREITVSELIEKAGVSRMTFYRKYQDIYDMHETICKHIVDELTKKLAEIFMTDITDLSEQFKNFCDVLESQKPYIRLLCSSNADRKFFDCIIPIIQEWALKFKVRLSENEDFAMRFVIYAGTATYFFNLLRDREYSYEYLEIYKQILDLPEKAEDVRECLTLLKTD